MTQAEITKDEHDNYVVPEELRKELVFPAGEDIVVPAVHQDVENGSSREALVMAEDLCWDQVLLWLAIHGRRYGVGVDSRRGGVYWAEVAQGGVLTRVLRVEVECKVHREMEKV